MTERLHLLFPLLMVQSRENKQMVYRILRPHINYHRLDIWHRCTFIYHDWKFTFRCHKMVYYFVLHLYWTCCIILAQEWSEYRTLLQSTAFKFISFVYSENDRYDLALSYAVRNPFSVAAISFCLRCSFKVYWLLIAFSNLLFFACSACLIALACIPCMYMCVCVRVCVCVREFVCVCFLCP